MASRLNGVRKALWCIRVYKVLKLDIIVARHEVIIGRDDGYRLCGKGPASIRYGLLEIVDREHEGGLQEAYQWRMHWVCQ